MTLKSAAKAKKVRDGYPAEVRMQNARTTGVTHKVLGSYQSSPARFLPKSRGLRKAAGAKAVKVGGF